MKIFQFVYKIILALIAIVTIIFAILYFCEGKNDRYLIVAVILALIISVLQIVNIILNKVFMSKHKDNNHNQK